jgi:RNA polymerase sigma-70 factor (ECF subfamily)
VRLIDRESEWSMLMRAAQEGDSAAYRRLLSSLVHPLRLLAIKGLARAGLGPADIEDVVQETLLAIHLKRETWDPRRPIGPWILAISRHKLIDVVRRRRGRIEVSIDDLVDIVDQGTPEQEATPGQLDALIATLTPRQQETIRLVSVEGVSIRAAASRLRISEGAVRVALHRGLHALAARIRKLK